MSSLTLFSLSSHSPLTLTHALPHPTHPPGGLIYVSGGDLKHRNGADVYYKFRPSSHFVYLTGVQEPGFAGLLDPETQRFTLVAPQPHEDAELWSGGLPSLEVLAEEAGADACIYAQDLPSYLQQHHAGGFGF
jgi:Xaa-Pro dipeptidase